MPLMMLNSVVLPAPLGPITPVMLPFSTLKETSSSAVTPPKIWVMPQTSSMAGAFLPLEKLAAQVGHQPHQAARHEDHHHHYQAAVDDDVVIMCSAQELRQERQQGRA